MNRLFSGASLRELSFRNTDTSIPALLRRDRDGPEAPRLTPFAPLGEGVKTTVERSRAPQFSAHTRRQLSLAPPNFPLWDGTGVFVDFKRVELEATFDVRAQKVMVKAKVAFAQTEPGYPLADLKAVPTRVAINGDELPRGSFSAVSDPDKESRYRALRRELEPGHHELELEYELTEGVKWLDGGVFFSSYMGDLDPPGFSEQFFPSNLEYDQYASHLTLHVVGADHVPRVLSNGAMTERRDRDRTTYAISMPEWYNTASLYLQIHNPSKYALASRTVRGMNGDTPVTAVVRQGPAADGKLRDALDVSEKAMLELERQLGPFPHQGYIVSLGGIGGMEHSGATRTSIEALSHETCHQWIARGALPAGGNHGWFDEGLASWRDDGYPRPDSVTLEGDYPKLSGFS
ncbi:MAG: hypothetical protein AAFY60_09190, partial [Myxococcota bacterium]